MNIVDLKTKIAEAKNAEISESFFSAAILYKSALEMALKLQNKKAIRLCKLKLVEMNKNTIESGKDLQTHELVHELSKEQDESLKNFIISVLEMKDKKDALKIIGQHPDFMPKIKEIEKQTNDSMPITYQITTLTSISDEGHNLRGGSIASYAWLMEIYRINQNVIMSLCLGKLMYLLTHPNPYGDMMTVTEISDYFSKSKLFNSKRLKIVLAGIKKYYDEDYISALHILVPQFESLLLDTVKGFGINKVALDTTMDTATRTAVLSDRDFDSEEFKEIFGEDFCRQVKFVLFEPLGYKLRHKIAHGDITSDECNFQNTTLVLYLYLVLLAKIKVDQPTHAKIPEK